MFAGHENKGSDTHPKQEMRNLSKKRPMSVCRGEKDRDLQGGMQIDRAGADGGGCEIDALNQEAVNI